MSRGEGYRGPDFKQATGELDLAAVLASIPDPERDREIAEAREAGAIDCSDGEAELLSELDGIATYRCSICGEIYGGLA